jgi:hypothetical protein
MDLILISITAIGLILLFISAWVSVFGGDL